MVSNRVFTVDLRKQTPQLQLGVLGIGDNDGCVLKINVQDSGAPVYITSTGAVAYMLRSDGTTVVQNGSANGSTVTVSIPEAGLAVPGRVVMAVRAVTGGEKYTMAFAEYTARAVSSDTIVDPGHAIPNIDDLLALIQRMEVAASAGESMLEHNGETVLVQDAQPTSRYNKLWIKSTLPEGIEIPTWAEHQESRAMIDGLVVARDEHLAAIQQNTRRIDGNTDSIASLATARDEHLAAIQQNTLRIDANTDAINANATAIGDNSALINGLVTARDEHAVAIGENTARIDGLIISRNEHAEAIGRNTARIDVIDRKVGTIEVSNGESLLNAVMAAYAIGFHTVNVHAGEYDIIAEYKAQFGADYFDTYSGVYNGNRHAQYDYGLWLDNMTLHFDAGARVVCNYTGTNADVQTYFCAFAIGSNVEIDGLVLDARNLRYGIHPDFSTIHTGDYIVFRNCNLHHYAPGRNNECIGAGLGVHTTMIFENCIFRSDMRGECLRIHNNHVEEAQSVIIMHGCYFDGAGHVAFNRYGPSTLMTDIYVSGCCWENPPVLGQEIPTQPAYNMRMKKWSNETIEFDIVDGNA